MRAGLQTRVSGARGLFPHLALLVGGAVLGAAPAAAQYTGYVTESDVMVQARDGVLLATDIHRPTVDGTVEAERLPVLLQRTPYGKHTERFLDQVESFTRAGYIVAIQDMRGRYGSQGTFVKYFDYDAPDGYDTIEYLAALPYTDGRVGMWGTSYGAHTQADAAKLNPRPWRPWS